MEFAQKPGVMTLLRLFSLTATRQPFTLCGLLLLQGKIVSRSASHNEASARDALYL